MVRKRRNKLRKGHALLLQDNAPPHRAGVTMATIEEFLIWTFSEGKYKFVSFFLSIFWNINVI